MLGQPLPGRRHDATRLHRRRARPEGALVARPVPAVALRRRLPRDRVLGRPGRGRAPCSRRASSRTPTPGRCAAVFADWQSCSEGGDELIDPSRSQYKEFFIVVNALLDGEEVTTCPYIWVDRDFALARGWIQGFPKKLGSIWITRHLGLDCAADPGLAAGRDLRRHLRRVRAAARRGDRDARARLGRRADPQRPAARQRPPLRAPRGRPARRSGRARARPRPQPRPRRLGDLGGSGDARALRRAARGARGARAGADRARASASRSPTRSTTSRPSAQL